MPDITIVCIDCNNPFAFKEGDQEFYKQKGFDKPKRCKLCRDKRKITRGNYEASNRQGQDNFRRERNR